MEVCWREKRNSSREIHRWSIHGTSFCGLSIVTDLAISLSDLSVKMKTQMDC
jgi:hypothetical protein